MSVPTADAPEKELKVKIPVRHHLRLHSIKVLYGKHISDCITEALDAYFAEKPPLAGVETEP